MSHIGDLNREYADAGANLPRPSVSVGAIPPKLDAEDERILREVWDEIGQERRQRREQAESAAAERPHR